MYVIPHLSGKCWSWSFSFFRTCSGPTPNRCHVDKKSYNIIHFIWSATWKTKHYLSALKSKIFRSLTSQLDSLDSYHSLCFSLSLFSIKRKTSFILFSESNFKIVSGYLPIHKFLLWECYPDRWCVNIYLLYADNVYMDMYNIDDNSGSHTLNVRE